jgi:transcriptional regulator with XRE-family HTH domain
MDNYTAELVTLGERLRYARNQAKVIQIDLAARLGVSQSAISNWEAGQNITVQTILAYMGQFDAPASWLFAGMPQKGAGLTKCR